MSEKQPQSNTITEIEELKPEPITIYTMPKQYVGVKEIKDRGKESSVGKEEMKSKKGHKTFIILLLGLLILIAASLSVIYFLIIKPPKSPVVKPSQSQVSGPEIPTQTATSEPVYQEPTVTSTTTESPPTPSPIAPSEELVQKVAVSYDSQGTKTTEAVLSLEKEPTVNYNLITVSDYVVDKKPNYFALVAGQSYNIQFRGENPTAKTVLSITYTDKVLKEHDLIPADLRIGYLAYEKLDQDFYRQATSTPAVITSSATETVIWEILKAEDVDNQIQSVSSVLNTLREGIYAIVPIDVNQMIELPPLPSTEPEPTASNGDESIILSIDSDNDMLTDKEELIYGTNPNVVDSDGDGYDDGAEVLKLYSPARGAGVLLEEDTQFRRFNNSEFHYSLLYPVMFTAAPIVQGTSKDIIFTSVDNQSILVSVQDNAQNLGLREWLNSISPQIMSQNLEEFTTRAGLKALMVFNKTVIYLEIPGYSLVYVLSYNSPHDYSYLTTMRMMVESFEKLGN